VIIPELSAKIKFEKFEFDDSLENLNNLLLVDLSVVIL